ncbi:MAG TPA: adenosylcobalamin-dependent ribonucleoside-diphosphate reductase [Candidatus Acidoferrum sp.]|nr:adenosylcobalamin-dependent ribonucleoside-diphosphate reductase [Candidatus Acidoferrum sp.]
MQAPTSRIAFTEAALQVLVRRILRRDERGTPIESPEEMFWRVAQEIAKVERNYVPEAEVHRTTEAFFQMMVSLDFLPNSPTLVNAGLPGGQLAGCFVLPIEDSMESIFGTLKDMALIQKSGGGTGFSFSRLRPRNDIVESTRGQSSGPISFMRLYDYACQTNRLGGVRSGANMGVMRFDHPDIMEFIEAKNARNSLQTFNISVAVSDHFVDCVRRSAEYPLINPHTRQETGWLNARHVFDVIVKAAWETGDPGLLFLDAINANNPTPLAGEIEATNPCGEQPLLPYESCNLGSINVARFVRDSQIEFERLQRIVHLAVRFLDDVIDVNHYPIPQIEERTKANRKIGLGVMGFADMLVLLGIPYDSAEALRVGKELMTFISCEAQVESKRLAEVKGTFPNYSASVYPHKGAKMRNATLTTIAPTGTISLIANCSSGIEPLFAICYVRQMLGGQTDFAMHPFFEGLAGKHLGENLRSRISESGSVQAVREVPERIRRLFVTAQDIDPAWHVRMQAAFQEHVDSAVSKTVNLRRDATPEDIAKTYLLAHELRCKGITVFRDGSRADQVLRPGKSKQPMPAGAQVCPECGGPMEHASACVTCLSCGYTLCTI